MTVENDLTITGQCEEADGACAPDYVFAEDYELMPLADTGKMIILEVTGKLYVFDDDPECTNADLVIDLCTPVGDAAVTVPGLDTPVGPLSTVAAVMIANEIKVQTAALLQQRNAMPAVLTAAAVVGAERSRQLFDTAYSDHATRLAQTLAAT